MTSQLFIDGDLFVNSVEGGKTTSNVPVEIYSNFSSDPETFFRQFRISKTPYTDQTERFANMGISNTGTYFYISKPMNTGVLESTKDLVITTDGYIGIGLTNPQTDLHVQGDINVNNVAATSIAVGNLTMTNITVDYDKVIVSPDVHPSRVPAGTIALWEDSSNIPAGWVPFDMGDRFPRGIASGGTPGNTTDVVDVSLSVNSFKSHTHGVNNAKYASGTHTHGAKVNINNAASNTAHTHTFNCSASTNTYNHNTHSYGQTGNGDRNVAQYIGGTFNTKTYRAWNTTTTRNFSTHNHAHSTTTGLTSSSNMSHNHNFSSSYSNSSWTHNAVNYTTGSSGTTNHTYPIIPKHTNYVFIIKQ